MNSKIIFLGRKSILDDCRRQVLTWPFSLRFNLVRYGGLSVKDLIFSGILYSVAVYYYITSPRMLPCLCAFFLGL
jgi:hypothetical protein